MMEMPTCIKIARTRLRTVVQHRARSFVDVGIGNLAQQWCCVGVVVVQRAKGLLAFTSLSIKLFATRAAAHCRAMTGAFFVGSRLTVHQQQTPAPHPSAAANYR
jgi:hypothetical protein